MKLNVMIVIEMSNLYSRERQNGCAIFKGNYQEEEFRKKQVKVIIHANL